MFMKTHTVKASEIQERWYVVDASERPLGRLARGPHLGARHGLVLAFGRVLPVPAFPSHRLNLVEHDSLRLQGIGLDAHDLPRPGEG